MKKVLLAPFKFILSLSERILAAAGAVILAQFPSFLVQYKQRLGGHIDELARIVGEYISAAKKNGKTLEEYINLHINSSVTDFSSTGEIMSGNVTRLENLKKAMSELKESEIYMEPVVFINKLDIEIFKATYENFTPAITMNIQSIAYAVIGIVLVMITASAVISFFKIFFRKIFNRG